MKKYNIAVVGATGLVGRMFLRIIEEYNMNVGLLKLFASEKSLGTRIMFKDKAYETEALEPGSFLNIHFALFGAEGAVSRAYGPEAVRAGAIVIDNSSAWRMEPDVPLVVPEVNLQDAVGKKLIANPNCTTIQCVVPLAVLHRAYGIESIEYNTYQAVSGAGKKGLDELEKNSYDKNTSFFPYNIKETCIPHIDDFLYDGYTKEEHKMINETKRILHDDGILISATCVRVPVGNGHGVSVRVTLKERYDVGDVRSLLGASPGLVLSDNPQKGEYPTSTAAFGNDFVYVGRIRRDKINEKALLFYVVADNIRKGAAANAVQIMKGIIENDDIG